MGALLGELETLREKTALIPWCQKCWWENEDLCLDDWLLLDAWFRSRSLELPSTGEAMIPCIDMVNHSSEPNAYYELTADGGVTLLLRPDLKLNEGSEATISYGASKSEAEMLFSYGFTGWESSAPSLTLTLDISQDDPLAKAKVVAFAKPPVVSLYMEEGRVQWQSPFLHLLCLNEEDGLQFRVLQQTDGSRSHLRVFWQGTDVTDATAEFESLTRDHELKDVFQLRAVTVLLERIEGQLERVYESEETVQALASLGLVAGNDSKAADALRLRKTETTILEAALAAVGLQKSKLMGSEVVLRYLGSMDDEERSEQGETNEEDFS